ncbi:MAG: phosphoribosylformylglycinamidine synthase subunit PurQ [Clostridiales bacterium]|nr:phosphoribosylformylglycinamidine synthase subunit PurQ [Clostridiales bacterium]
MADGFTQKSYAALSALHKEQGFTMSLDDLVFVQSYFRGQRREPTYTELKVIDAYWSCRHTTFTTALKTKIKSNNPHIAQAYADYTELFNHLYDGRDDKYPSLMDVATIGAKVLREKGFASAQDISQENNACTITQDVVKRDGTIEPWYILFKNETNNRPTEIEPSGGGATCLGRAVFGPISGRVYAYQAMRVSGGASENERFANGYSSYANRMGLPTGEAREYYHSGYAAQRPETSFVVGAAPQSSVVRDMPRAGDLVLLIGGASGATTARKLQRLMKSGEFARLIKRGKACGAGGVAVALGELSSSVDIELTSIPQKCAAHSATELAISEGSERLAIVIAADDLDTVTELCHGENVDATVIAKVTDNDRLRMFLNGNMIVDLERRFLDSNGVRREATALIKDPKADYFGMLEHKRAAMYAKGDYTGLLSDILGDINVCSQKGLSEMFDSTVGGNSVFMPLGGKKQLTPTEVMAAKIPTDTDMCTVCAHGMSAVLPRSPFIGGMYSVILAVEKLAAAGVRLDHIYLSLQEFFARCTDAEKWGAPMSALLGALTAQLNLKRAAIGGNDCMSGTFEKLTVPPTLIAFGLGVADSAVIVDNTFKAKGERVYRYRLKRDEYGVPDFDNLCDFLMLLAGEIGRQNVTTAAVVERGGAAATVAKSCFGGGLGFAFASADRNLFEESEGDIIFAARTGDDFFGYDLDFLGLTTAEPDFLFGASITRTADGTDVVYDGKKVDGNKLLDSFTRTSESVYPTTAQAEETIYNADYAGKGGKRKRSKSKPQGIKVFIPVFDGTNGETDIARRFELAGAQPQIFVVRNRDKNDMEECVKAMADAIKACNILALPGGYSDGADSIAALLCDPVIAEAVENMLYKRDGLAIGLGGGFNALIKSGLLPSGHIHAPQNTDPVLTLNNVGRHVSRLIDIRVCSTFSPWLKQLKVGDVYQVPVSCGEGKLSAGADVIEELVKNGQIATQYCDMDGNATMASAYNPSGSMLAIEGIVSADGRVLGKMGHSERTGEFLLKNTIECYAKSDMRLFESGVKYFK